MTPPRTARDVEMYNAGVNAVRDRLIDSIATLAARPTANIFKRRQIVEMLEGLADEITAVRLMVERVE